jgi:hypothetical protein
LTFQINTCGRSELGEIANTTKCASNLCNLWHNSYYTEQACLSFWSWLGKYWGLKVVQLCIWSVKCEWTFWFVQQKLVGMITQQFKANHVQNDKMTRSKSKMHSLSLEN